MAYSVTTLVLQALSQKTWFGLSVRLIACACFALPVFADSLLTISDSSGIERARTEVDKAGKVEFSLTDASGAPAQGAEITLTNIVTNDVISTTSIDGVATFEGVPAGQWTVASITPGITFTDINLGTLAAVTSSGLGALSATTIAGGAVAVGGTAVGIAAIADSSDNNDPLSPST